MYLLFLLSFTGCLKKDMARVARSAFTDENCVKTLETYMRSAGCPEIDLVQRKQEIIIRCKKDDSERGAFWDNYWFRITPAILNIVPEQLAEVEKHTICKDSSHRVEAYPPN